MADDDLLNAMKEEDGLLVASAAAPGIGSGGGPLKVTITENEVLIMALFMCPISDIASFYNFSERQLYRRFAQYPELRSAFTRGRAQGRRMIRRKQFLVAMGGDPQMLKWLGMNVLGQSARHAVKVDDIKQHEMDSAIDVEFEEVFDKLDEELRADGYEIPEVGDVGDAVLAPDEGQGQSHPANPKSEG